MVAQSGRLHGNSKRRYNLNIKHKVKAIERDKFGNIVKVQSGTNTVTSGEPVPGTVENGYVMVLERMFDDGATIYDPAASLDRMQLGTGTPGNSGLGAAIAAGANLISTAGNSATLDKTTLTAPKMDVSVTWGASYGALTGITEAGILNADGELFAYKAFTPALSKDAAGSLTIEWSVTAS